MLYRDQSATCGLSATSVVVALDAGQDHEAELFAGVQATTVRNVPPRKGEGGLCVGVVSARVDYSVREAAPARAHAWFVRAVNTG